MSSGQVRESWESSHSGQAGFRPAEMPHKQTSHGNCDIYSFVSSCLIYVRVRMSHMIGPGKKQI